MKSLISQVNGVKLHDALVPDNSLQRNVKQDADHLNNVPLAFSFTKPQIWRYSL